MPTELAPSVAEDSTLPQFAVPADVRQWGARVRLADRNAIRATAMLVETILLYGAFIVLGQSIDRWWGWVVAWIGLVMCMMRIDAVITKQCTAASTSDAGRTISSPGSPVRWKACTDRRIAVSTSPITP